MARSSRKLPANAFAVERYRDRWLARGADGEPVGTFLHKAEAERAANARRQVYEIVTQEKAGAKSRSELAREQTGEFVARAGRPLSGQAAAEGGQKLLSFAAKPGPAAARSQEEPAAAGLTAADLEKALAKQKAPKGAPVSTARTRRSKTPPTIAEGVGEVKRKERKRSTPASRSRGGKQRTASSEPVRGGFVLEDPAAGLSAHDLTRMLAGQLRAQAAQPPAQGASLPAQSPNPPAQPAAKPRPPRRPKNTGLPQAAAPARPQRPPAPGKATLAKIFPRRRFSRQEPAETVQTATATIPAATPAPNGPESRPGNVANTAAALKRNRQAPIVPKLSAGGPRASGAELPAASTGDQKISLGTLASTLGGLFSKLADLIARKLSTPATKATATAAAGGAGHGGTPPQNPAAPAGGAPSGPLGRGLRFGQRISNLASGLLGRRGTATAGATAAAGGSAVARGAGMAGNVAGVAAGMAGLAIPVVGVTLKLASLAKQLSEVPKAFEAMSEAALDGRRDLARFNGSLAVTFAKLDALNFKLSAESAKETAGTTKELAAQYGRLRQNTQPFKDASINLSNRIKAAMVEGLNEVIEGLSLDDAGKNLREISKNTAKEKENALHPAIQFLDNVAQGRWEAPKNDDPRGRF